jgi:hypothetical protein
MNLETGRLQIWKFPNSTISSKVLNVLVFNLNYPMNFFNKEPKCRSRIALKHDTVSGHSFVFQSQREEHMQSSMLCPPGSQWEVSV